MAWYKAVVILAWLSVPVAGSLMLRSSYDTYLEESAQQREDCTARVEFLNNYVAQSGHLANQVVYIDSVNDRLEWDRSLQAMQRQMQADEKGLRPARPAHYPETDSDLLEAEQLLDEQISELKEAAWKRDAYIKSGDGMFELGQQIANTKMTAGYYQRIGAEGIYLLIQEDLARLEDIYRQRNRERNALNREMSDKLAAADRKRRDIQRILLHLDKKIASDEQLTFREKLRQHAEDFQLRREFEKLIDGEA